MNAPRPPAEITWPVFTRLYVAVMLPMFMSAIDQTLLATATPAIAAELGELRDTSWISVAYLLAAAVSGPVYGRAGDALGRRRVLFWSLSVFAVGAVISASATSLPWLIAGRVVQGLGGGGLITLAQSLIGEIVPPRQRVRFQAYFAATFTAANISGPVIGGLVVSHLSWRWLFLAYLPLCAVAWWRLSKLPSGERHPESLRGLDFGGLALFALGTVCSLYWLVSVGHDFAWLSAQSFVLAGLGIALVSALVWHQAHHRSPFLPVDLLRMPAIAWLMATAALFSAAVFSMIFFLPIYLQLGLGLSASTSGLLLLPLSAGTICGSWFAGNYAARTGEPKVIFVGGLMLGTVSLLLLNFFRHDLALVGVFALIAGAGFGTVMPVVQVGSQALAGRTRLAAVGALVALFRAFGAALGVAAVGALLFGLLPAVDLKAVVAIGGIGVDRAAIGQAFHWAFLCSACFAGGATLCALRMPALKL